MAGKGHPLQTSTLDNFQLPFLLGKKALNNIWVPCNAGKGLNNFLYLVKKGSTLSIYVGRIVHVHVWRGVNRASSWPSRVYSCARTCTRASVYMYVWSTGYGCGAEYLCVYSLIMAAVVTVAFATMQVSSHTWFSTNWACAIE